MQVDFVQALRDIGREKDIPLETLSGIIEAALVSAYKKHYGAASEIHVDVDWEGGEAAIFSRKQIVEHVENPHLEMSLSEARRLDPTVEEGEYLDIEVSPEIFGRIAAQTAKQVVAQRIREAEREIIYSEFSNRDGDIVTGVVQRRDTRTNTVYIDLGKIESILPPSEQSPLDSYRFGERIKVYVLEVKRTTKTPRVLVSRSHPGLLRRLFELEVPEVHEGIVEIKTQAREAGARSKVAVWCGHENVDPVGACVGHRGSRVQAVVDELRGEKVDIVRWSDEPEKYVAAALSPAKVTRVIVDEKTRCATVVAPDNQLSLAIGREGQNVRLAARLTGWRIDIRSEAQIAEIEAAEEAKEHEAAETAEAVEDAEGAAPEQAPEAPGETEGEEIAVAAEDGETEGEEIAVAAEDGEAEGEQIAVVAEDGETEGEPASPVEESSQAEEAEAAEPAVEETAAAEDSDGDEVAAAEEDAATDEETTAADEVAQEVVHADPEADRARET